MKWRLIRRENEGLNVGNGVYMFCISLLFLKLLHCSPPIVKFYFYCHASFKKKITDSFFSVLPRPRFLIFIAAIMDRKSWDTFAFLGRFPIHTGPNPPSHHKQC